MKVVMYINIYQKSFLPSTIRLWNNLSVNIRNSPSSASFKLNLKNSYDVPKKPPDFFFVGSRLGNMLHTRLRRNCSSLKSDLFRCNIIDICYCDCGNFVETVEHFFFICPRYTAQRENLFQGMRNLHFELSLENILFGNSDIDANTCNNSRLFLLVQKFILDSKRFV